MRIATFTTLYPNAAQPRHGIFVATRLAQLRRVTSASFDVVAPVAWFPSASPRFGRYAAYAQAPRAEVRDGIRVFHPRYLTLPGAGMYMQPYTIALAGAAGLRQVRRESGDFDLIDAHYLFPDGVAAASLARRFGKPLVVTARGSDVNVLSTLPWPRRHIARALAEAAAVIAVSCALKRALCDLGIAPERITVLRNGVDTRLFHPVPRAQARTALGLPEGPVIASVGNLVPDKGHELVMRAVAGIEGATLVIVGDGPEARSLAGLASALGVAGRVRFVASVAQRELASYYSAADVVALASAREGWPNVLLESMACGTPVVATAVGGVPEIVTEPVAGIVVQERAAPAFAEALRALLAAPRDRARVRRYAEGYGWDEVVRAQAALYERVASRADTPLPRGADRASHAHTVEERAP